MSGGPLHKVRSARSSRNNCLGDANQIAHDELYYGLPIAEQEETTCRQAQ
jgi:hypothetical protein